jgi:hypothetical protein
MTMATRFLAGERILEAVRQANEEHATRRLGVAYWGAGAVERLALGSDLHGTRVICDLWSEGCHADAVLELVSGGAQVVTVEGFHAKTYLYPNRIVLGSANASRGGLGTADEPPARAETALLCEDTVVLADAAAWFEATWRRGTPVDAALIEASRGELAKVRDARRPTLLQALAHEPDLFGGLDLWVALYDDGGVSYEAETTWEIVRGEYGTDDMRAYDERGEVPFYEVEDGQLGDCREGRIYLDFSRSRKGKPTFNGVWKVRTSGHRSIVGTGRSLVLLDQLPSLRGRRIVGHEMKAFGALLGSMASADRPAGSPEIREAVRKALKTVAS